MTMPLEFPAVYLVRPQAGDLLILTCERHLTPEQQAKLGETVKTMAPGVKCLALAPGIQLAEIHTSQEHKRLLGQLLVLADLLDSAVNVVGTVLGDTDEEDQALEELVKKSKSAIAAVLTEHAMGKATGGADPS